MDSFFSTIMRFCGTVRPCNRNEVCKISLITSNEAACNAAIFFTMLLPIFPQGSSRILLGGRGGEARIGDARRREKCHLRKAFIGAHGTCENAHAHAHTHTHRETRARPRARARALTHTRTHDRIRVVYQNQGLINNL